LTGILQIYAAIIAGLLIGFILMIQPSERAKLLGEPVGTSTGTSDGDIVGFEANLLLESPGRIDYIAQTEIEHPLPVVNIFSRTDSKVLGEKGSAIVKKSLFSEEQSSFKFSITDLANTENVLLAFKVGEASGRLIVSLNGEEIFNANIGSGNIDPLALPKAFLRGDNEIMFSVSSPGLAFWSRNSFSLESIKVVGEVKNVEAQSSTQTFLVSETEKRNMEKVVLKFQPSCQYDEVGPLVLTVNGQELYNAIPDCDIALVPIEFSADIVKVGENKVTFRAERGTFVLSHILVASKLQELDYPTYYFDVSHEQYEAVKAGLKRLRMGLDFVDVVTSKYGVVVANGHQEHFDTKEASIAIDLSTDIVQGTNSVKIKPSKTLELRQIRVDLIK